MGIAPYYLQQRDNGEKYMAYADTFNQCHFERSEKSWARVSETMDETRFLATLEMTQ